MKVATFIALALCLSIVSADNYAVLIAGSNSFWNYRHQADVCHAYHVLIDHGIKAENIITLAYDDIANAGENPFPGKVFNKPDGDDVYAGCNIDYKGSDVTIQNFIGVLTGNSTATGGKRVLNSTDADNVFINFADHGGTGLICVIDDYLYADTLLAALKTMNEKKMYKKLVFYMEACESGSMFTNLPSNLNIFAHTAANPDESSWGFYCSPDDVVQGKEIGSCLGDTWSISWMEDSDVSDLTSETLDDQFNAILKRVNQSHPQTYGDLTMKTEVLSNYQGSQKKTSSWKDWIWGPKKTKNSTQMDSRLIKLAYLERKSARTNDLASFKALEAEKSSIHSFDTIFSKIDAKLGRSFNPLYSQQIKLPADLTCLRNAVNTFEKTCMKFTEYGLKYTKNLAHLCYTHRITNFVSLFKSVCAAPNMTY